ncbi:MAG: GNAT family N-acetyltransferase [bacterium]
MEDPQDFFEVRNTLIELYQRSYAEMDDYHYKNEKDIEQYIDWLYFHNTENSLILLAKKNQEIVGFIAGDCLYYDKKLQRNSINIHELVVKPEYRGMKIATYLIGEFITRARQKNKQRNKKVEFAILWVGENNHKAMNLYKTLGFSVCKKDKKWLKMELKL